jgi:hypothetical protein
LFAFSRPLALCHALKSSVRFGGHTEKILTTAFVATVFSPILLRDPEPLSIPPTLTPLQKRRFLGYFLA